MVQDSKVVSFSKQLRSVPGNSHLFKKETAGKSYDLPADFSQALPHRRLVVECKRLSLVKVEDFGFEDVVVSCPDQF